jgi:hypothetical protein
MHTAFRSLTSWQSTAWPKPVAAEIPHSIASPAARRTPRVLVSLSMQRSPNMAEPQSVKDIP